MKLRERVPKATGSANREALVERTWSRISGHLRRAGVTRMADITDLDRIGIPVYSAIVPRSNDGISVYNGKGATKLIAKTSAAMEAIERFASWLPIRPAVIASFAELTEAGRVAMNPRDHSFDMSPGYRDDMPISWVCGWDLLADESVLVPHDAAGYQLAMHEPPVYTVTTTNGLASGNSLEEAICHALCEVVERDTMTIAELTGDRLSQVLERGLGVPQHSFEETNPVRRRHPHVALSTLPPGAQTLVDRFHRAGVILRVRDITSELGVPTFYAGVGEDSGPDTSTCHAGMGTHPDAEVAFMRAVTECAQSRAMDIQAMREDISLPDAKVSKHHRHAQRTATRDPDGWLWRMVGPEVPFGDIPSCPSDDIIADISHILGRLRACGMQRAIVVDLSPPEMPVSVARVIVPGLESWAVDRSKIGVRATAAWNSAVREAASVRQASSAVPGSRPARPEGVANR